MNNGTPLSDAHSPYCVRGSSVLRIKHNESRWAATRSVSASLPPRKTQGESVFKHTQTHTDFVVVVVAYQWCCSNNFVQADRSHMHECELKPRCLIVIRNFRDANGDACARVCVRRVWAFSARCFQWIRAIKAARVMTRQTFRQDASRHLM